MCDEGGNFTPKTIHKAILSCGLSCTSAESSTLLRQLNQLIENLEGTAENHILTWVRILGCEAQELPPLLVQFVHAIRTLDAAYRLFDEDGGMSSCVGASVT